MIFLASRWTGGEQNQGETLGNFVGSDGGLTRLHWLHLLTHEAAVGWGALAGDRRRNILHPVVCLWPPLLHASVHK